MTNNTLSQETAKLKDLIASYESNKAEIEKQMEGIDEKYRKLAEAEKAALSASAAFYDTAISAISALVNDNVKTEPKKEKKSGEPEIKVEQEEEKVVDNLFPENNETETKEDEPIKKEVPAEDPGPEFDGAGFTSDDEPVPAEGSDEPLPTEEFTDPNDWDNQVTEW